MKIAKEKMQLIHHPKKGKMGGLFIVFIWIAIWNIAYQLLHGLWHDWDIQIVNWAFFASVTLFFMQEELTYKERFWYTLVGGNVGFIYFIVSFVKTDEVISKLPGHMLSLLLGSAILNLGCTVLLNAYKNRLSKKQYCKIIIES